MNNNKTKLTEVQGMKQRANKILTIIRFKINNLSSEELEWQP